MRHRAKSRNRRWLARLVAPLTPLLRSQNADARDQGRQRGGENRDRKQPTRQDRPPTSQYLWVGLVTLLAWGVILSIFGEPEPRQLAYSEFKEMIRQGEVQEVTFFGHRIRGLATGESTLQDEVADREGLGVLEKAFTTNMPETGDPKLLDLLESQAVTIRAEPAEGPWWARPLITILPWILILGFFFYLSYRMQKRMTGGGDGAGGLFGFGKSKAKRFREDSTDVDLDDVAGVENAKRDLQEIIDNLSHPERYRKLGARLPRGVLLIGPPGTGKTLMARAVAGEAGVPFYSISGSEFVEMFVGVGAARVRDMFQSAKQEAPCVIFIDEIDAVGRSRGAGLGGGHDEREQTLNQILSEMDGFSVHENVVVLAATNRPDVLDAALLRPGRFDRKVTLDLPDRQARHAILQVHVRQVPLDTDVDLEKIAARTVGFSGADLQNLVNEAALLAGREHRESVDLALFEAARDKLILGAEREHGLTDEERQVVAYHESGHALMAWLLPEADPLEKVTIIPRGRALGATEQLPQEERLNLKRSYLLDRIGVMLGGRVAEQTVFGDVTSGAESDLEQATHLARRMVCRWGMSEGIGPVAIKIGQEHVFLGREISHERDFSEDTARLIDDEVKGLLEQMEQRAHQLMTSHRDKLERLAETLLQQETVDRETMDRLFEKP